jgi:hypothetical protein
VKAKCDGNWCDGLWLGGIAEAQLKARVQGNGLQIAAAGVNARTFRFGPQFCEASKFVGLLWRHQTREVAGLLMRRGQGAITGGHACSIKDVLCCSSTALQVVVGGTLGVNE